MGKIGFLTRAKTNRGGDADVVPMPGQRVAATLLPILVVAFILFLVTGVALPVLPLHVHRDLGLGTFVVGLVAGAQFGAALLSRFWSGHYADSRGAKRATVAGLLLATAAGLFYLLSLRFVATPVLSVAILLLGRAVLGAAESCVVTGALSWGLALVAPQNAGKVMAWVGLAMYVALAVGAPAGTAERERCSSAGTPVEALSRGASALGGHRWSLDTHRAPRRCPQVVERAYHIVNHCSLACRLAGV